MWVRFDVERKKERWACGVISCVCLVGNPRKYCERSKRVLRAVFWIHWVAPTGPPCTPVWSVSLRTCMHAPYWESLYDNDPTKVKRGRRGQSWRWAFEGKPASQLPFWGFGSLPLFIKLTVLINLWQKSLLYIINIII